MAVQVGNVLEIVPTNKIVTLEEDFRNDGPRNMSPEEEKQQVEKLVQVKLKRKLHRERKRCTKAARKEKLRQEIQRYVDAGVAAEHSDDENLIPLRAVNISALATRSIILKVTGDGKNRKKVLFSDGILPGETTSEEESTEEGTDQTLKQQRKKLRKRRMKELIKSKAPPGIKSNADDQDIDQEAEKAPLPPPPTEPPPACLKQPRLKKITAEMFAAFPVNPEPMYYYIQKIQENGYHHLAPSARLHDRFNYYKKQPPPIPPHPGFYQRSAISKPSCSGKRFDDYQVNDLLIWTLITFQILE